MDATRTASGLGSRHVELSQNCNAAPDGNPETTPPALTDFWVIQRCTQKWIGTELQYESIVVPEGLMSREKALEVLDRGQRENPSEEFRAHRLTVSELNAMEGPDHPCCTGNDLPGVGFVHGADCLATPGEIDRRVPAVPALALSQPDGHATGEYGEPWQYKIDQELGDIRIYDANGVFICLIPKIDQEAADWARRIVGCVNMMAGCADSTVYGLGCVL